MLSGVLLALPAALAAALTWTPATPLPDGYSGHALVASGGSLYNIGGISWTNGVLDGQKVFAASTQADGSLSAWTPTTPLPEAVFYHAGAASGSYVYVLGGYHYSGSLDVSNVVYVAKRNADGTLGSWSTTTPLPQPLFFTSAAVWNGRIYIAGGWNGAALSNAVYSAVVNADGTLGPWVALLSLPDAVYTHATVSDGTLYVLGGVVNGGTQIQNTVYAAPIAPDGSLQPWTTTTPLPQPVANHGAIVASGRVYVLGGWTGAAQTADVISAPSSNSTLGGWGAEAPLPQAVYMHGVAVSGGRVYVSGGASPAQTTSAVSWSPLPAAPVPPPPPAPQDQTAPVTTLAIGQPQFLRFVSNATPFSLSATDDLSGVATTYVSVDGAAAAPYAAPFTLTEGAHWLGYYSVDKAGNAETVHLASAAVDATAPVSRLSAGAPQAVLGDGSLVISSSTLLSVAADDPVTQGVASGVRGVSAAVGGQAVNAAAPFALPAADGRYAVSLQAVDNVGNVEAVHAAQVSVDATAPASTLSASPVVLASDGGAPWLNASSALAVTGADPVVNGVAAGVNRSEYGVDAGPAQTATATFVLPEGAHTVSYRSVDNVGNAEAWRSQAYRVDATPPVTALTVSGSATALFGQDLLTADSSLALTATDSGSGVKSTSYAVDGAASQPYAGVFHLAAGAHTVAFGSVDLAGNAEPLQSASVTVGTLLTDAVAASDAITLSGSAAVTGDVRAPSVTVGHNASVSGTVRRVAPASQVDLAAARAYAQAHNGAASSAAVSLSGHDSLALASGIYLFAGLSLSGNASLSVAPGVQIFLTGPLQVSGNASFNSAGSADDLWIFSDAGSVDVSGNGRTAFHLYAPDAAVTFTGNGQVAGRVFGRTVALSGNSVIPSGAVLAPLARGGKDSGKGKRPDPSPVSNGTPTASDDLSERSPSSPALSAGSFTAPPAPAIPAPGSGASRPRLVASTRPPALPVAPKAAFAVVTGEGSTVRASGGPGVVVPAGALSSGLGLTVNARRGADAIGDKQRADARSRRGLAAAGDAVEYGPEGTQFAKPVTIELPFDPSLIPAGTPLTSLAVHYWNPKTSDWEALPSVVDAQAGVVRAQTSHFSLYQVNVGAAPAAGGATGPASVNNVYVYPNPARGGAHPTIRVELGGIDSVDVSVYDMAGELKLRGAVGVSNGVAEYPVDVSGLGSGVYLYVVKAGGQRRTGRLAVIK